VRVEIWSDIACPWCYVGKRRFEAALAAFDHRADVKVTWRSFELDPTAPAERPEDRAEHLAAKYGMTRAEALAMEERMTQTAAAEGLDFRFDLARAGNTFDAHRHLHLAAEHGLQDALEERIMRAYLTEGELISDAAVLGRLAREVGLPAEEVEGLATTDRFAAEVRDDEATARSFGINAVPFFVFDRAFGASGAQPPAVLGELLQRAWDARPAAPVAAGDTCSVDGC
jgi:predicted DsbA family dithiol-disulfide isomerase